MPANNKKKLKYFVTLYMVFWDNRLKF